MEWIHLRVQTAQALHILGAYLDSNPTNKKIETRRQKIVNKVKEIQDCGEECIIMVDLNNTIND